MGNNEKNHSFLKFMSDLIDSGIWSRLSVTARTLYPVLCRFSNESFSDIWPGTQKLLELTGFKSKKSLQEAKRELIQFGLLGIRKAGNGRESTRYFFKFDYPESRVDIDLYRAEILSRRGVKSTPPGEDWSTTQGDKIDPPNYINININQSEKYQDLERSVDNLREQQSDLAKMIQTFVAEKPEHGSYQSEFIKELLNKYGHLEVGEAIKIAIQKDKKGDIRYLEGILRNRDKKPGSKVYVKKNPPKFNAELNHWLEHMELKYEYRGIYYFTTYADLPILKVIEDFSKKGFPIKLYQLKDSQVS